MNEQEKYYGRTPVVTAHMEARMKASREYAKMASNDDETPAQRADRARAFECGAIWEEGTSKSGWRPASELPPLNEDGESEYLIVYDLNGYAFPAFYSKKRGWCDEYGRGNSTIKYWCYPPTKH